jgi:hypothetical protein
MSSGLLGRGTGKDRMNYLGVIKAGAAAGLLLSLSQFGWNAMVLREPGGPWLGYNIALGFWFAWLYAWLLTRGWDSGVKTALLATVITGFGLVGGTVTSAIGMVWSLASMVVAGVLVAKLYREPEGAPSGD